MYILEHVASILEKADRKLKTKATLPVKHFAVSLPVAVMSAVKQTSSLTKLVTVCGIPISPSQLPASFS